MNAADIRWGQTDLPLDLVTRILGADHVAWVRRQPFPVGTCEGRAAGAWTANDRESNAAYLSLAAILRGGA